MTKNDKIKEKYRVWSIIGRPLTTIDNMLNEARDDTTKKHIGTIWEWWATKPQVRKNDATIRIITRTDIEELVRLMK